MSHQLNLSTTLRLVRRSPPLQPPVWGPHHLSLPPPPPTLRPLLSVLHSANRGTFQEEKSFLYIKHINCIMGQRRRTLTRPGPQQPTCPACPQGQVQSTQHSCHFTVLHVSLWPLFPRADCQSYQCRGCGLISPVPKHWRLSVIQSSCALQGWWMDKQMVDRNMET